MLVCPLILIRVFTYRMLWIIILALYTDKCLICEFKKLPFQTNLFSFLQYTRISYGFESGVFQGWFDYDKARDPYLCRDLSPRKALDSAHHHGQGRKGMLWLADILEGCQG